MISCCKLKLHAVLQRIIWSRRSISNIRIGCASGFWGDTATSVPQLVKYGKLDFLVFDYLSEITMSLLAHAKKKSPDMGYTSDFIYAAMAPNLQEIKKRKIRIISNAGGINPEGCANALKELSKSLDLELKIAVVTGDNLMNQKEEIQDSGIRDMKKGFVFPKGVHSMNAYLGAGPIAKALDDGADIVLTGRCVDSALALGPLISTFQWSFNDWDKLAAGSLAGHLIECGAQATGGIYTDWHLVPNWHMMGFPIVDCENSGRFTISKPPNTGGLVTVGTVSEQLLYEIDDPTCYALPDVVCDFSNVNLSQISDNTVLVEGALGKEPSDKYKVSATFSDGYRATAACPVIGPNAILKARKTAESILKRSEMVLNHFGMEKFRRTHLEILGAEHSYGKLSKAKIEYDPREVVMWCAVHHDKKEAVALFAREIAAAATGAAPGLTSLVGGRPKVSPILKLFSFLYPKDKVKIQIVSDGKTQDYYKVPEESNDQPSTEKGICHDNLKHQNLLQGSKNYHLRDLAYTRSGDKGNTCNIGVIARDPSYVPYIEKHLTADAVANYFEHLFDKVNSNSVKRYYLPGIHAFNFVLEDALGEGGVASLRSDPQGKACGQILSDFILPDMPELNMIK